MKALILCIDRDDDIGNKTGIKGPIVGREDNVRAANRLGLADPEDADLNTLYSAISTYDKLVAGGLNAEIATICGDKKVGRTSDEILTKQLDEVLEETKPNYTYLISDGAEDEYIFPIIASRIKVNHVKRVFVRQSPTIESTFYLIVKTLKDDRMRKKILMPPILILLIWGAVGFLVPFISGIAWNGWSYLYNIPTFILPLIALVLGLYFLFMAYSVKVSLRAAYDGIAGWYVKAKSAMIGGDFSLVFSIIGLIFIVVGVFLGLDASIKEAKDPVEGVFFFIGGAILWVILGVLMHEGGKVAKAYQQGETIKPSFWIVTIALFVALIVFTMLALIAFNILALLMNLKSSDTVLILTVAEMVICLVVIIAGSILYRSMQERAAKGDAWRR